MSDIRIGSSTDFDIWIENHVPDDKPYIPRRHRKPAMITAIEARGEDGGDFAPKAPPSGLGTHVELIDELVRTQVNKPSTHKASHVLYDFNPSIHPADHDHLKVRKQFGQLLTFLAESPLYFTTRDQTVHDQNGRITYRMLIGW